MNKSLPNKWIRKAIFQALNNIVVDGETIPCYVINVSGDSRPNHYTLISTQSNIVEKANKCEYFWDSDVLIDINSIYQSGGNTGRSVTTDNITDEVRRLTDNIILDPSSGLEVITQTQSFPNNLSTHTDNQIINRNFVRITMRIK